MGFVKRLNSKELVGDPCAGAEVYPITATNAVYREGGENLEDILSRLGNQVDRNVIQDISYISTSNKLHKEFTNGNTEDITLPNWIKNVTVTNSDRTYTITVTPTTGNASTYQITLPEIEYPVTDVKINNSSIVSNKVANIVTNSPYDASTNKIATMNDLSTNSNQKISAKNSSSQLVSFGENATIELIAGDNVGILPDTTNNTITISSDKETLSCYDFTVTSWNGFKKAVARSLGWSDSDISSGDLEYMCSTKNPNANGTLTRIHFGSNFGSGSEVPKLNLSYATVYGYDYNLKLYTLQINSPTCTFNRVKFWFAAVGNNTPPDRIQIKTPQTGYTHYKYNFEDCQFNRVSYRNGVSSFIKVDSITESDTVSLKLKYSMFGCEGEVPASATSNYADIIFLNPSGGATNNGTANVILISTISPDFSLDSNTFNKFHVDYKSTAKKCTLTFDSSSKINKYTSTSGNNFDPSSESVPGTITNCVVNKLY